MLVFLTGFEPFRINWTSISLTVRYLRPPSVLEAAGNVEVPRKVSACAGRLYSPKAQHRERWDKLQRELEKQRQKTAELRRRLQSMQQFPNPPESPTLLSEKFSPKLLVWLHTSDQLFPAVFAFISELLSFDARVLSRNLYPKIIVFVWRSAKISVFQPAQKPSIRKLIFLWGTGITRTPTTVVGTSNQLYQLFRFPINHWNTGTFLWNCMFPTRFRFRIKTVIPSNTGGSPTVFF